MMRLSIQRITIRPWTFSALLVACVWFVSVFSALNPVRGQESIELEQKRDDDRELLDGLRRRRLFESAEFFCRNQLANPNIDPTSQASLVIELMKTLTTKAMLSNSASRAEFWKQVETTSADFEQAYPDHPRKFLVQVQQALSHIAHGRLLQQELDAEMAADSARVEALNEIRTARRLLGDLQREVSKAIPDQQGRNLTEHELTSEQLLSLNNNLQYQLAVCNLIRAQLYEASDRLNRIDALNGVSQRLEEVQRVSSEGQPLWWKTKLGQIECLRLLGTSDKARLLAESLSEKELPLSARISLLEQKARVAIELGDETFSRSVLTEFNESRARTAQLELAIIELAVDLSARAASETRKQEWISFAAEMSKSVEQTYGGYWRRRADLILIAATDVIDNGGSPEPAVMVPDASQPSMGVTDNVQLNLLIRLADEAARKDLLDDAFKAYDRAAKLALSLKRSEQALQMDFRAGRILEKQGKHRLAAERLISSAIRADRLPLAPSSHLIGCWNFAKSIDDNRPEDRKQFSELLLDHLRRWSSATSADQIRVWLASEHQARQEWNKAFDVYLQVRNDSPLLETAVGQGIACANRVLLAEQSAGLATQATASRLTERLLDKFRSLQSADPIAAKLILGSAELDLIFGSRQPHPNLAETIEPIEAVADLSLANTARAIHAVSISISDPKSARMLISRVVGDVQAMSLCERCLAAVIENPATKDHLTSLQTLRLAVIESALEMPAMNQPENEARKTGWMLRQSAALVALERHSEAISVLTALEKKFPRNASVQIQLGRAMSAESGRTDPQKALNKWRRIAARLKSHTPNWYEAKYEVARLLFESGDSTGATKLLKYVQANPPGWDNSTWKPKFEQLLRDCEAK